MIAQQPKITWMANSLEKPEHFMGDCLHLKPDNRISPNQLESSP